MTILQAAYQFAKDVKASSPCTALREKLRELNTVQEGRVDRSTFGYMARQQRAQLYGYVLLDQMRGELISRDDRPLILPDLDEEERELLLRANAQILELNAHCVQSVLEVFPNAFRALSPYGRFPAITSQPAASEPLFAPEIFATAAAAFQNHPAIQVARAAPRELIRRIPSDALFDMVQEFESSLTKAGVLKAPGNLIRTIDAVPRSNTQRVLLRYINALTCLRASVRALDQMFYQALISDRLPVLSSDNVIAIQNSTHHYAGHGLRLIYQPDGATFHLEPGDSLLITDLPDRSDAKGLFRVEATNHEFSQDLGHSSRVDLRQFDDNLNLYQPLLEHS